MAAKKKGAGSTSADALTSSENAIVPNATNNEDASVDRVTDGEFEVGLHDLSISPEDIEIIRRVEARLAERLRNAHQAAQAGPSTAQMTTRMKGKERMLSDAELEEQLNKLKEEKLQCKMMHQRIQAKKAMLQQDRAPRAAPEAMTAHGSGVIRPRPQPIVVDDLYHGNTDKEEEGKY
jgi:uncharacterized protein (DUF342 family)